MPLVLSTPHRWALIALAALLAAIVAATIITPATALAAACPTPENMTFPAQGFVDKARAGGEPTVTQHPDGTLLYGAHAGTTHFYSLAAADEGSTAFGQNYQGQTYIWWSQDDGKTWNFAPRVLPPGNAAASGFSDPEWAIDTAGQTYASEINLANIAVSKSLDSGKTWTLQNFFGEILTDRQWKDADLKDVLYLTGNSLGGGTTPPGNPAPGGGHYIYRSADGGKTFPVSVDSGENGGSSGGDIIVDKRDGTLYEARSNGTLGIRAFRNARAADLETHTDHVVAEGVSMLAHWPSFDIDSEGNLYMTWDESGSGDRPAGIYYSFSTDQAKTWSPAVRASKSTNTQIWPWISVGDKGKVAIAWFEADEALPDHAAETPGSHGWRVVMAGTLNGLGCAGSTVPSFTHTTATKDPIHRGTICQGGTVCQAQAIDRRLGDFFTIDIDNKGRVWAGYSDTSEGGATSLPGFVRQDGGPLFRGGPTSPSGPGSGSVPPGSLPATGTLFVDIATSGGRRVTARKRGIRVRVRCTVQCRATGVATVTAKIAKQLKIGNKKTVIAKGSGLITKSGRIPFFLKLTKKASKALAKKRVKKFTLSVAMQVTDKSGGQLKKRSKKVTLR